MPSVRNVVFSAMPGDDARQGDRQDDQERDRLAAEEPEAMDGEGDQRAEDERDRVVAPMAAWSEARSALRIPSSLNALTYQSSVSSVIGQLDERRWR